MTTRPLPMTPTPWLTKSEAAERGRVSDDQVAAAIRDGSLRIRRVGRRVVIHQDWLDAWLLEEPTS